MLNEPEDNHTISLRGYLHRDKVIRRVFLCTRQPRISLADAGPVPGGNGAARTVRACGK